jgi:hypothetical protein
MVIFQLHVSGSFADLGACMEISNKPLDLCPVGRMNPFVQVPEPISVKRSSPTLSERLGKNMKGVISGLRGFKALSAPEVSLLRVM